MTLADVVKPYLWLALVAFIVGFLSYLALGRPAEAQPRQDAWTAPVSAPVSDDWNVPKHI